MDKITFFKKLVKDNRQALLAAGLKASTLSEYANGNIFPSLKAAKKIALITGKSIKSFPTLIRNI